MSEIQIPRSTQEALSNPAATGARHSQMTKHVLSLLGSGLSAEAVFSQFRSMYGPDVFDSEIRAIVNWGVSQNPGPPRPPWSYSSGNRGSQRSPTHTPTRIAKGAEAIANVTRWLDGFECDEAGLWEASQIRPPDGADWRQDSVLWLATLHAPRELVSVNTNYKLRIDSDGRQKVDIIPPERIQSAEDWIAEIKRTGAPPQGDAGCWVRLNPVKEFQGTGSLGSVTDDDIADCRDLLIESDELPYNLALSFLARVPLPLVSIMTPAGRGPHGRARLRCRDAAEFRYRAKRILSMLAPYGFDAGNCNPSRYGRLPGARRIIGADELVPPEIRGRQRLLYLAPESKREGIFP
jgi:hypothetical protein